MTAAGALSLHEGAGLDFEDLLKALERPLNHAGTAPQAAEFKE
ncbi:hypothetical protein [Neoaquamicrobium sediminum]|nr:hypothetical protein [Mesorhizobium sediminum]